MTGELVIYQSDDGQALVQFRPIEGSLWLTQLQLAELYGVTVANINIHLRRIVQEGELATEAVVKQDLIPAADGKRYLTKLYRLDMVLAVGYRVRSARGTQFRQWATAHLAEYLVKGFVMDDERLKNPGGWDHFDELLARIREIRASEKRFYQKVRDLFALSSDYRGDDAATQLFFAEVQNKLLYAVTRQTAAELIQQRADAGQPNMGLTTWEGSRVRKADVIVAKNYLRADEVDTTMEITMAAGGCARAVYLPYLRASREHGYGHPHTPLEEALANAYAYNALSFISRVKVGIKTLSVRSYQKLVRAHWHLESAGYRDAANYIGRSYSDGGAMLIAHMLGSPNLIHQLPLSLLADRVMPSGFTAYLPKPDIKTWLVGSPAALERLSQLVPAPNETYTQLFWPYNTARMDTAVQERLAKAKAARLARAVGAE